MRSEKTVAVIGAGAAGLAAAIEIMRTPGAVGNGVKVILIEKLDRVGKKILSTGNGRCNLSNINASADGYFGGRALVDAAFKRFSPEETLRFFRSIGLLCSADECDAYILPAIRRRPYSTRCGMSARDSESRLSVRRALSQSRRKTVCFR